jgi:glucan 1,3-beta-glucosidase
VQLLAFEHYRGWFFWSYRTETTPLEFPRG